MADHILFEDDIPEVIRGALAVGEAQAEPFPDDEIPRNSYIGGSEAYDACVGDRFGLYELKTGLRQPEDLSNVDPVIFGKLFESVVAAEYARRTEQRVRRSRKVILHPMYPFMGVHLDRVIEGTRGVLEVKTGGIARINEWGEEGSEDVPPKFFFQGQHAMACTDREFCEYPVLFGGQFFRIYRVGRDEKFIEAMIALESEFWRWVTTHQQPDPTTSTEANRRWPVSREGEIQADETAKNACQKLAEVKDELATFGKLKEELELVIKSALADKGDTLMHGTVRLATWKSQKGHHVDAYDTKPSRVLRLSIK